MQNYTEQFSSYTSQILKNSECSTSFYREPKFGHRYIRTEMKMIGSIVITFNRNEPYYMIYNLNVTLKSIPSLWILNKANHINVNKGRLLPMAIAGGTAYWSRRTKWYNGSDPTMPNNCAALIIRTPIRGKKINLTTVIPMMSHKLNVDLLKPERK